VKYEVAVQSVSSRQVAVVRARPEMVQTREETHASFGPRLCARFERKGDPERPHIFIYRDGSRDGVTVEVAWKVSRFSGS